MATYTFTGYTEADFLQGVNGSSIGYGDVFTMPSIATTEFVVTDDDGTLSGDYWNNEQGDDSSGQTADITINGVLEFDDVKIYAEQYHVLMGSDGNYYYMIEIELAGSDNAPGTGDDFFTFWGNVPPAGVELTVYSAYNITCDWVDYDCLDSGPVIQPPEENQGPLAEDDAFVTDENTTVSGNVLDNDSDPDGDAISVTAVEGGNVGEAFQVTTAQGHTGMVTLNADGTFTFDPDDNFKALAQSEQDSFNLTYTITDDPQAATKHNLLFVLDISNSTVSTSGQNAFDGVGVGDLNGDGLSDTVLDAQIAGVISAVNKLIAEGADPADIDIGIVTFSGIAAGYANVDAETLGTFSLDDSNLFSTVTGIQSGGWTNYEAGLQQAEAWLAGQQGDGARNKVMFLSDGRPYIGHDGQNYIAQSNADYGDEVAAIANTYGADIHAIGVGGNSDLDYLNDLDNTGGAERVLDTTQLNTVLENAVALPKSDTATITVTVNGLNDGPIAMNDALTVCEDEAGSINILANDSDPNGDPISITDIGGFSVGESFQVTTAAGRTGTVTVQADGTLTFDPGNGFLDLNDAQTDSFELTYTITDGLTTTSSRTLDFEGLAAGDVVSNQIAGVTVTAQRNGDAASSENDAMVFDADNPTGGDSDLGVAGVGNLLIISEDNDSGDPDDNAGGGTFTFEFDNPTQIDSLTFVDIDSGETPPSIVLYDASGAVISTMDGAVTGNGQKGDVAIGVSGVSKMEVTLHGSGGIDDLAITETTTSAGLDDTATVTVVVNGKGVPVDAVDDAFSIQEEEDINANLLDNDTPNDGSLSVVGVAVDGAAQTVGSSFTVTTDGGRTGTVTVDDMGNFTFDGGDNFIELADGQTDTFDLTYTVEGAATAGDVPKHNIMFVIDVSGSTSPAQFAGSPVGDQNGDGVANSVLDAEIAAYKALSAQIASSGLTDDKVDIGLVIFSGNNSSDQTGASQLLGTFKPGDAALDAALEGLTDGGFTNFEAPLQTTIGWFEDQAATTSDENLVYFLSDGMQNVGGTFDDEAAELATRFDAKMHAVGVGTNAVLSQLNVIDNTGGAEIVTTSDDLTAALVDSGPVIPGAQDTATVTVTINGVGVAAGDDALQTDEATAAQIDILANDTAPAGENLCVLNVSGAVATNANVGSAFMVTTAAGRQGMVTVMEDGTFDFDPEDGFTDLATGEQDSFMLNYTMAAGAMFGALSYELYDGTPAGNTVANIPLTGAAATGTVTDLDVSALATAATGSATTYAVRYTGVITIEEGGVYDFSLGSDDGSALFINGVQVIDNDGLHGNLTVNGQASLSAGQHEIEILFFQNLGGAGLSLTYSGTDTGGAASSILDAAASQAFETASAMVEVTVLGLDSAPVANPDVVTTDEDTAVTSNILTNDTDPEGDVLTVLSIEGGTVGTAFDVVTDGGRTGSLTVQSDGTVTFDPAGGFEDLAPGESDTVTLNYTATDGVASDTSTVQVIVNGLNDAPVANPDQFATDEDLAVSGNILTNDTDPDRDVLSVSAIQGGTVGTAFSVATADGRTGEVTVQSDGSFTFDPQQGFLDLKQGETDSFILTYTASDGLATSDSTVEVIVHGKAGGANVQVTINGNVTTEYPGTQAISVVIDVSAFGVGTFSGASVDFNGDATLGAVDLHLGNLINFALTLDPAQELALHPTGENEANPLVTVTAGQIATAKAAWDAGDLAPLQALFHQIKGPLTGETINLEKGFQAAKTYLDGVGADSNEVLVLASSDGFSSTTFEYISDPTMSYNDLVDPAGLNADVDIVLIKADTFADETYLAQFDNDGTVEVLDTNPFGLDSLIDPAPTLSVGDVLEVEVNGQVFAVSDADPATDGFQFSLTNVDIEDGTIPTVLVGIDQNGNAAIEAGEKIDVTSLLVQNADVFSFDLDAVDQLLV